MRLIRSILICLILSLSFLPAQDIKSPEAYFGHVMGADRQLIDWKQIVEYFRYLDERFDRILVEELGVPAVNVLKDVKSDDFYAPGTIFQVTLDASSFLTCGMPATTPIYFIQDPAYTLVAGMQPHRETAVYGPTNPLLSGWVLGEKRLRGKVALAEMTTGKGRAVLYGFRVQNRAQTWGTFKLLFNALYIED